MNGCELRKQIVDINFPPLSSDPFSYELIISDHFSRFSSRLGMNGPLSSCDIQNLTYLKQSGLYFYHWLQNFKIIIIGFETNYEIEAAPVEFK